MIMLEEILKDIEVLDIRGNKNVQVDSIVFDSRKVVDGSLFVAQRGTVVDGHTYIEEVVAKGVVAVVCEAFPESLSAKVCYIKVPDTSRALGYLASAFYGYPSKELQLVGVTGTNGKTSVATLLYDLFRTLGYPAGLLSTIANFIDGEESKATHTTPDAVQLNALLRKMVDVGCEYCFIEVSSHALVQNRVAGLEFRGGIFTNLTHDHLDYHETFMAYMKAKKSFFDYLPKGNFALVNTDDRNGRVMLQNTKAEQYSYAIKSLSDYHLKVIERHFDMTLLAFDGIEVWTKFIGDFNAYNLLSVYAAASLLGVAKDEILLALSTLKPVKGRFDTYTSERGITAVVDYAHTPDALENVLKTLKELVYRGKIITVVGAGGNRDKSKRPEMARIACEWSDKVILTSDNPRDEVPEQIVAEMYRGVPEDKKRETVCIVDRKEALKMAGMLSEKNDVILIAGKGHETYQEVKGKRTYFNDKEEIIKILE